MVEYNKYCLRYRYFFLFQKIEKILIFIFKLINIEGKKSNLLIPGLKKIKNIKFKEQDIFNIEKKYFQLFDVIRVSNLLNYSYFSKQRIKFALNNLNNILRENGIILINRTTKQNKNLASFFIKKNGKFELLEDLNGGSEIKDLILSIKK